MIRLHLKDAQAGEVEVVGPPAHYLRVLRARDGDEVEVFDGRGLIFMGRLIRWSHGTAILALGPGRGEPPTRAVTVLQGLPKADKLELVLQKGTELGAAAFRPVLAERSVVKLHDVARKLTRWQSIAQEAARQCRRADVPEVLAPLPLAEAVESLAPGTAVLLLDEQEHHRPLSEAAAVHLSGRTPFGLVVGPEGGLTDTERRAVHALGATSVTLGRRVLRTETAALAALAVLRHLDGELG